MNDISRRAVVKASVWAVPVIAAVVATPLAAASGVPVETKNRLRFGNFTATEGKKTNSIYANTIVIVNDGPDPVENLNLTISVSRDGVTYAKPWSYIPGWGDTKKVAVEFPNIPKGEDVVVTFTAWADGCVMITETRTVKTPSWWDDV